MQKSGLSDIIVLYEKQCERTNKMNNAQDRIVAQVAGKPIMESEIDATLMQMGQRAQSYNNPQGRAMILEQLINKKLFLLDAQRNLIEREPAFK